MTYVQASQGGGGWPMSVFLTPELKPIVGGTYFPPDDKYGRPGFKTVLKWVSSPLALIVCVTDNTQNMNDLCLRH